MVIALKESVTVCQLTLELIALSLRALLPNTITQFLKHVFLHVQLEHIRTYFPKLANNAYPHVLDVSITQRNAQVVYLVLQPFISINRFATHLAHLLPFYHLVLATIVVQQQTAWHAQQQLQLVLRASQDIILMEQPV